MSATRPTIDELQRMTPADFDRLIEARTRELQAQYQPLPAPEKPKPAKWTPIFKFLVTLRRFERVFAAQGEPLRARWLLALRYAAMTVKAAWKGKV